MCVCVCVVCRKGPGACDRFCSPGHLVTPRCTRPPQLYSEISPRAMASLVSRPGPHSRYDYCSGDFAWGRASITRVMASRSRDPVW